jgi:hypothetical protein
MTADLLDPAAAARGEGEVLLHSAFWGSEPITGKTREAAALMETLWRVVALIQILNYVRLISTQFKYDLNISIHSVN